MMPKQLICTSFFLSFCHSENENQHDITVNSLLNEILIYIPLYENRIPAVRDEFKISNLIQTKQDKFLHFKFFKKS